MSQLIFVNLPVFDVQRSRKFFAALGFTFDERFSGPTSLCVVVSEQIYLMALDHASFAGFAPRPLADPSKTTSALIALSRDGRDAVDGMMTAALAHGGTDNGKVQEMGDYMYGRSFSDPDGNVFEPMWMDLDKAMQVWGQAWGQA